MSDKFHGRTHIEHADGLLTDPDGSPVGLFAADCREPAKDDFGRREVGDVTAYRLSDGECMNTDYVMVKGLPQPRQMGRITVARYPHDGRVFASGMFGWDEHMGKTKAGERLTEAVEAFYMEHPELTSDLSEDKVRECHLSRTLGRVRLDREAYWSGQEYLRAGGDVQTLRAALIDKLTREVNDTF